MTANVLEHRRARAFADAVEDRPSTAAHLRSSELIGEFSEGAPHPGPDHGAGAGQFAELLAMVDALGAQPVPTLDPQVKLTQRALLMAEFERVFAAGGGTAVPSQRGRGAHRATEAARRFRPSTRWGRRLAVSGLAAGMAMGALGGVAMASSSAIPGDSLYGMKRGLENWHLDMAGSDAERGRLLLDEASQRMAEAEQLTSQPHSDQGLSPHVLAEVAKALTDMNAEGSQGRDLLKAIYRQDHALAPMQRLAQFDQDQQRRLSTIEPRLGGQLVPVTTEVQQLLSGISADLAPLHLSPGTEIGVPAVPRSSGSGGSSPDASTAGANSTGQTAGSAPQGATTSGTGTLRGDSAAASPSSGGGAGGVVGSLTGGLLGNGAPSTSPSATAPGTTAGAAGDSGATPTPAAGNGITIPPLIPGLLPSIGIGVSGGG
jgi:hypothetical protein